MSDVKMVEGGMDQRAKDLWELRDKYASLLARHNALREAVAWERECDAFIKGKDCSFHLAWEHLQAARAEVDLLLTEENY